MRWLLNVCSQMCREAGIECREVLGYSKGLGYEYGHSFRNAKSDHSWNAVSLDGQWYLLDACWGAGTVDIDKRAFTKKYNEFYFLTDPRSSLPDIILKRRSGSC
ncbi:kyphoscoliosis peptidase-like [Puntigrus tetrazona]|uniref:kyphoscoliosis peptidase-like n=1 Tax=Puntigrus tetrazona TaxID=1606681 RepID=UPI001C8A4CF3|nr:kyphoscoliosis peptidase-like [Puntigrus tetrazona]